VGAVTCSSEHDTASSQGRIANDFNNVEMAYQPSWVICESSDRGVEFGGIELSETSEEKEVSPRSNYGLLVAVWNDPSPSVENALPITGKNDEEVVAQQSRTIAINMANDRGLSSPDGVQPIPETQYE
jgi:hypothetical protein